MSALGIIALVLAAPFAFGAVAYISLTFSHRMDAIDRATDRAGLEGRIDALELELGFREMTDDEVRRADHAPPGAVVDDEYRQYATQKYTGRPLEP